jgi:hypothetical protein
MLHHRGAQTTRATNARSNGRHRQLRNTKLQITTLDQICSRAPSSIYDGHLTSLDKLQSSQTCVTVLADDDVLVDGNAERGGDLDDRLGRLRWRRIAGGGCASKRTSEDFRVGPEAVLSQAGGRLTCYRNFPGWGNVHSVWPVLTCFSGFAPSHPANNSNQLKHDGGSNVPSRLSRRINRTAPWFAPRCGPNC